MAIHNISLDFGATGILEIDGQRYGVKSMALRQAPDSYPLFEGYLIPEAFAQSNAFARRVGCNPEIKKVIFNAPATVVMWSDGTKTVVKCQPGDTYSKETGLALCIAKKFLGNKGNFNEVFKRWIPEEVEPVNEIFVENMRQALDKFCWGKSCHTCPLCDPVCRCGCGTHFLDSDFDGKYVMGDDEIRAAYKVVFG